MYIISHHLALYYFEDFVHNLPALTQCCNALASGINMAATLWLCLPNIFDNLKG